MIADVAQRVVYVMDSLGTPRVEDPKLMTAFLEEEECKALGRSEGPQIPPYQVRQVNVPRQPNGSDCGVFTLHFAEKFASSFSSEGFLTRFVSLFLPFREKFISA
jgi:Ulp1 family protease